MKRLNWNAAVFGMLMWLVYGCSLDGDVGTFPIGPAPELLSVEVVSETKVAFEFSAPVRSVRLTFDPALEIARIEEGRTVTVSLERSLEPGTLIVADIRGVDANGNTFSERASFTRHLLEPETGGDSPGQGEPGPETGGDTPDQDEPCSETGGGSPEQDEPGLEAGGGSPGQDEPGTETGNDSPGQDEPGPGTGDGSPGQDEPAPETGGGSPGQNEPGTETGGGTPEQDEPAPETGNGSPGQDEPAPETGSGSPGQDEPGTETGGGSGAPEMVINELRTEPLVTPSTPPANRRAEFVEFRMLSAGNLDGLRVFVYRSGLAAPTVFEFPDTEVNAGEFVVLHLRTLDYRYVDAQATAHNFWIPGSGSRLNKNSAVYVLDRDDRVLAAVMLAENAAPAWNWGSLAEVAAFLFERGAWKSPEGTVATPADAVLTARIGTATTRSVSRDETVPNTNTAADWYLTATGGVTPGLPNNPRRL